MPRFVRDWLYPTFDCEDCIGMKQYGCQCAYYQGIGPGVGPGKIRKFLRRFIKE